MALSSSLNGYFVYWIFLESLHLFTSPLCFREQMVGSRSGGAEKIKCHSLVCSRGEDGSLLWDYGFNLLVLFKFKVMLVQYPFLHGFSPSFVPVHHPHVLVQIACSFCYCNSKEKAFPTATVRLPSFGCRKTHNPDISLYLLKFGLTFPIYVSNRRGTTLTTQCGWVSGHLINVCQIFCHLFLNSSFVHQVLRKISGSFNLLVLLTCLTLGIYFSSLPCGALWVHLIFLELFAENGFLWQDSNSLNIMRTKTRRKRCKEQQSWVIEQLSSGFCTQLIKPSHCTESFN